MNWLNIETKTLRAREYIGSEPVHRATWLNLLGYCAEQENGGRIENCSTWKERQWMQTCGVTLSEVQLESELWRWDGHSLVIWNYPVTKEREVSAKRNGGKRGGEASGEARREAMLQASGEAMLQGELERKGKERNRKKDKGNRKEDAGASNLAASPKRERKAKPIDDDHLAQLQTEYPHAKVREQFTACTKWWLEKKQTHPSRLALRNWLNKVQPPPSVEADLMARGLGDKCRPL